jgi:hypothetical protein
MWHGHSLRQAQGRLCPPKFADEFDFRSGKAHEFISAARPPKKSSRWSVRNQLALGTLKLARIKGVRLPRMFSLAYPAGPEPTGNAAAFRRFTLSNSFELAPRPTGKAGKKT